MEASKAIRNTNKNIAKILFKKAIKEIKSSCKKGEYSCKIEVIDIGNDIYGKEINDKVLEKLTALGYSIGSTEVTANGDVKNINWKKHINKQ